MYIQGERNKQNTTQRGNDKMKKLYVEKAPKENIESWMNKGHVAEFSARKHFDNTLERYFKDSMPYTHYSDIETDDRKISIKTVGCEFKRIDKEFANSQKDTFKLLADTARDFIEEDYSEHYWIMIEPKKQDPDRPEGYYTVIELNKQEMLECIIDTCVMDNGKLRLKKTHDSFMTWYREKMGLPKVTKKRG